MEASKRIKVEGAASPGDVKFNGVMLAGHLRLIDALEDCAFSFLVHEDLAVLSRTSRNQLDRVCRYLRKSAEISIGIAFGVREPGFASYSLGLVATHCKKLRVFRLASGDAFSNASGRPLFSFQKRPSSVGFINHILSNNFRTLQVLDASLYGDLDLSSMCLLQKCSDLRELLFVNRELLKRVDDDYMLMILRTILAGAPKLLKLTLSAVKPAVALGLLTHGTA
jgi:hypothetical protein